MESYRAIVVPINSPWHVPQPVRRCTDTQRESGSEHRLRSRCAIGRAAYAVAHRTRTTLHAARCAVYRAAVPVCLSQNEAASSAPSHGNVQYPDGTQPNLPPIAGRGWADGPSGGGLVVPLSILASPRASRPPSEWQAPVEPRSPRSPRSLYSPRQQRLRTGGFITASAHAVTASFGRCV